MVLLITGLVTSNLLVTRSLHGHLVKVDDQTRRLAGAVSRLPPVIVSGDDGALARGISARSDPVSDLYVADLSRTAVPRACCALPLTTPPNLNRPRWMPRRWPRAATGRLR